MTDQTKYINAFNTIIKDMSTCAERYYEDNREYNLYKTMLDGYIAMFPDGLISHFILHVYRNDTYRNSLANDKEEMFFLRDDCTNAIGNDMIIDKIFILRTMWQKLDEAMKLYVRRCMQTMVKICGKYILLVTTPVTAPAIP